MKKKGFTLAEVLITLGIIGVIAAITLPTLMTDTTSAQIGPKLAKAVAVFEQANQVMLNDSSVDAITEAITFNPNNSAQTAQTYLDNLSNYLKGSVDNEPTITTKDGIVFCPGEWRNPNNLQQPPHRQHIGTVWVDINGDGANNGPNLEGTDRFTFALYNDGSLRPKGSANWNNLANSAEGGTQHWSNANNCPLNVVPTDPTYCAGHIFENNLKVFYR